MDLDNDSAAKLIAALPQYSVRKHCPVRDFMSFVWQTVLRCKAVQRLRFPEHCKPGSTSLRIADDIDKVGFGCETQREPPRALVAQSSRNASFAPRCLF